MPCWPDNNSAQISLKVLGNGGLTWPLSEPCIQPSHPSQLVELGTGMPSHTPGALPGHAAIAQDLEAAAALRRTGAPGLGWGPEGQKPEHAQRHPHGSRLRCNPGRGLAWPNLSCLLHPAA